MNWLWFWYHIVFPDGDAIYDAVRAFSRPQADVKAATNWADAIRIRPMHNDSEAGE